MKFDPRRRASRGRRLDPFVQSVNPDDFFGDPHRQAKPDYHTLALCKLVHRTLAFFFSSEVADPVLQDLVVHEVLPAPNASHLLVAGYLRTQHVPLAEVLARLDRVQGVLRARIAEVSVRKRVPDLSFQVFGRGVEPQEVRP